MRQTGQLFDDENQRRLRIEELRRRQLARRLHDGPIQAVAALALRAHLAKRQLASNPPAAADEVQALEDLARSTTQDLRYFQFTLVPGSLESAGLAGALEDLVRHLDDLYGHKVQLTIEAQAIAGLNKGQGLQLFHIAAEALDNTRKHAQASSVQCKLTQPEPGVLIFEVEDDGLGFDPKKHEQLNEQDGPYGLAILRERAKVLGAELHIRSATGSGTLLRLALPVKSAK